MTQNAPISRRAVLGIRSPIPAGHIIGRVSGGDGDAELIPISSLGSALGKSGSLPPAGVTKLIAGTNVSLSPAGGTGSVTVNATGGSSPTQYAFSAGNTITIGGGGWGGSPTVFQATSSALTFANGQRTTLSGRIRRQSGVTIGIGFSDLAATEGYFLDAQSDSHSVLYWLNAGGGGVITTLSTTAPTNTGWYQFRLDITPDATFNITMSAQIENITGVWEPGINNWSITSGTWYPFVFAAAVTDIGDVFTTQGNQAPPY